MSGQEGFIGDTSRIVERIRADFAPWFSIVERLNRLAMQVLPDVRPPTDSNQLVFAAVLYGRTVTSIQAAVLLAQTGLAGDARTIVRAATETAMTLGALVVDESVLDDLLLRHAWSERALRNAWLQDPQAVEHMTPQKIAVVRNVIAEIERDFPKVVEHRGDPLKIERLARKAGALALYNAIYRPTSSDAAHTSLSSLHRHVKASPTGEIDGLRLGPDISDLSETLSHVAGVMTYCIDVAINAFQLEKHRAELRECTDIWTRLGEEGKRRA